MVCVCLRYSHAFDAAVVENDVGDGDIYGDILFHKVAGDDDVDDDDDGRQ